MDREPWTVGDVLAVVATLALSAVATVGCFLVLVAIAGCGSSPGCALPSGGPYVPTYELLPNEAGNDCGAEADQLATGGDVPRGCELVTLGGSSDRCDSSTVARCPSDELPAAHYVMTSAAHWTQDASGATGTVAIELFDAGNALLCSSSYSVALSRPSADAGAE